MNIFLMQHGFPMTIIQVNDRQKYYRALQEGDHGNYKPLCVFIAQAILRSLSIYIDVLTPSKEKLKTGEQWVSLHDAAKFCSYSQAYLGKLAKEGKIDAHKLRRNWVTTEKAIKDYLMKQKK